VTGQLRDTAARIFPHPESGRFRSGSVPHFPQTLLRKTRRTHSAPDFSLVVKSLASSLRPRCPRNMESSAVTTSGMKSWGGSFFLRRSATELWRDKQPPRGAAGFLFEQRVKTRLLEMTVSGQDIR
jgi:hypothetical protein